MRIGTCHHDLASFNRLAQGFQHISGKLGEFIQEQHAIMRQADFAGLRATPPLTECPLRVSPGSPATDRAPLVSRVQTSEKDSPASAATTSRACGVCTRP